MKSIRSSVDRKPLKDAAAIRQTACRLGCRQVTAALSSSTGRLAERVGRHSSTGGVSASDDNSVTVGDVISTPPGACWLAATNPDTRTTDSSPSPSIRARTSGSVATT